MMIMIGQLAGVKEIPNRNNPDQPPRVMMGVQMPKTNGFPGETITQEVRLTKSQLAEGYRQKIEAMQGKRVQVPFFIMANAKNDRAYITYFLDSMPKEITGQADKAA